MKSTLFGFTAASPSTTAVNYLSISSTSSASPNSVETTRLQVVPNAFTLSNLYVSIVTAPTAGKSYTYTVRKNGVDTALKVVISDTNTSATDNADSVSFAQGDTISLSTTPTGTPTAPTQIIWNLVVDSGGTHYAPLLGGGATVTNLSTAAVSYSQLTGASNGSNTWNATELNQEIICPTGGTISNLYVVADVAPGAGTSYAIALVKNGSLSLLSATVSNTSTSANDTTHTITVAAGDTLSIAATPTSTPVAAKYLWGLQFTPTNAGESFFGFGSANTPSTTATQFEAPLGVGFNGYSATETARQLSIGATTVIALYVLLGTAPSGVTTRTATIRNNAASTAAATTITGVATTGNITGQSIAIAQSDLQSLQMSESGTPAADTNGVHIGVLVFQAVPTTASGSTALLMGIG